MDFFEKLLNVLKDNLGYTAILAMSVALFAMFSNGLTAGIITALSGLLAYICFNQLYIKFKNTKSKKKLK